MKAENRIVPLDGLRGLLIAIVFLGHADYTGKIIPWLSGAVDGFFVLSGYLISRTLIKYQGIQELRRTFLLKRCVRIMPPYFAALTISLVLTYVAYERGRYTAVNWFPGILQYPFMLQNLEMLFGWLPSLSEIAHKPYGFGPAWSLAIEEQFYLIAAALVPALAVVPSNSKARVPIILIALTIVPVLMRYHGWHWYLLIARYDGLVFGVVLAFLTAPAQGPRWQYQQQYVLKLLDQWLHRVALVVGMGALYFAYGWFPPATDSLWTVEVWLEGAFGGGERMYVALMPLAWAVVFSSAIYDVTRRRNSMLAGVLRSRALIYFGQRSYSVYLTHVMFLQACSFITVRLCGGNMYAAYWLASPFALAGGVIFYRLVELPALRAAQVILYRRREGSR